jgi:hypothetical protein
MAEQFALGQAFGNGAAMHGDKCEARTFLVEAVNGAGKYLFPGPGFALQKYRRVADLGCLVRALQDRVHALAGADKAQPAKNLAKSFGIWCRLGHSFHPRVRLSSASHLETVFGEQAVVKPLRTGLKLAQYAGTMKAGQSGAESNLEPNCVWQNMTLDLEDVNRTNVPTCRGPTSLFGINGHSTIKVAASSFPVELRRVEPCSIY